MKPPSLPLLFLVPGLLLLSLTALAQEPAPTGEKKVDFLREVQPILEARCFSCHGAKKQKAGLRLDQRAAALAGSKFGKNPVIVPGNSEESLFFQRIVVEDEFDRMPPDEDPLPAAEVEILRQWLDQGANWPQGQAEEEEASPVHLRHWAYNRVEKPPVPKVQDAAWVRNPIDQFLLAGMEAQGLKPNPEADPNTLLRRAHLDVTGLPPTTDDIQRFLAMDGEEAWQESLDRLLSSPARAEHHASRWLDLARYADSHGYEKDGRRVMWRYRNWVIQAFQDNMPFDQFTIEQIAGDLLPEPTLEQRIATGFHRNTMINQEGGIDPEEFRVAAVMDRVNTTMSVWMGTTFACASCHNHKYDPFSQKEYYQFLAFFNNTQDTGNQTAPELNAPTEEQSLELAELDRQFEALQKTLSQDDPELDREQRQWEAELRNRMPEVGIWRRAKALQYQAEHGVQLTPQRDGSLVASGPPAKTNRYEVEYELDGDLVAAIRLECLTHGDLPYNGPGRAGNGNFVLSEVQAEIVGPQGRSNPILLTAAEADHEQKDGFLAEKVLDGDLNTGWAVGGQLGRPHELLLFPAAPFTPRPGQKLRLRLLQQSPYHEHTLGRFRIWFSDDLGLHHLIAPPIADAWHVAGPFPPPVEGSLFDTPYGPELTLPGTPDLQADMGANRVNWTNRPDWTDGRVHALQGGRAATYLYRTVRAFQPGPLRLRLGSDDAIKLWWNGELVHANNVARGAALDQDLVTVEMQAGENHLLMKIVNTGGDYAFAFSMDRKTENRLPYSLVHALQIEESRRHDGHKRKLREFYRQKVHPKGRQIAKAFEEVENKRKRIRSEIPKAMVMAERPETRATHVMLKGNFLIPGDEVQAAVPAVLHPLPSNSDTKEGTASENRVANRLDLARWLVDRDNPLTARVLVNRLWLAYFGQGLVSTIEDFGSQGARPTHPELLDWLAAELMDSGWNLRHLERLILESAAYRQSAKVDADALASDPLNLWMARAPRYRLSAEGIRDLCLQASGLLTEKVGGPSVFPPQPDGTWAMTYSGEKWTAALDDNRWRRGMYTFWRRTAPYPTFMLFDAPSREVCITMREKSNTPLQALAVLNDPVFVEAASALARCMLELPGADAAERIDHGFLRCTSRLPKPQEREVLLQLFAQELAYYRSDPDAAMQMAENGGPQPTQDYDEVELAAWTVIANVLLNLDETLTRS